MIFDAFFEKLGDTDEESKNWRIVDRISRWITFDVSDSCERIIYFRNVLEKLNRKRVQPFEVSVRARGVIFGGDLGAAGGGACPTTSSFDLGGHRAHR